MQSSGATWTRVGHALGNSLNLDVHVLEGRRSIGQQLLVVDLLADDGVRANHDAFAALDAQVGFPDRDLQGDVALFPLGGAGGEGAVDGNGDHGQVVAVEGDDLRRGRSRTNSGARRGRPARRVTVEVILVGDLDLVQVGQGAVHGLEVLLHHGFTALAVGLFDGMLDLGNGLLRGAGCR